MSNRKSSIAFVCIFLALITLGAFIYCRPKNQKEDITPVSKRYYIFSDSDNGTSTVVTPGAGIVIELGYSSSSSVAVNGGEGPIPMKEDYYQGFFVVSFSLASSSRADVYISDAGSKKKYKMSISSAGK